MSITASYTYDGIHVWKLAKVGDNVGIRISRHFLLKPNLTPNEKFKNYIVRQIQDKK